MPYKINTVLTDNGTHFTTPGNVCSAAQEIKECLARSETGWAHAFERVCATNDIDHLLTKPKYPWTNRQVERMNRTLKEATVRRYHYDSHEQLREHLAIFLAAYNFAKRLKTLRGPTPHEHICKCWDRKPGSVQAQSIPPHAGTKHQARPQCLRLGVGLSGATLDWSPPWDGPLALSGGKHRV